jgi:polysaccharide deacetylase family protein (PEP-CTERM system associated)
MTRTTPANCFSVDLEEWYHIGFARDRYPRCGWEHLPSRVEWGTERLLGLCGRHGVKATFFVLGQVASRFPAVVRRIADRGHRLGCHGMWHERVCDMTQQRFREDLKEARDRIAQAAGAEVVAFRAPEFSVRESTTWFMETLAQEGILFDSSLLPVVRSAGGIAGTPLTPHEVSTPAGIVREFPPTVLALPGLRLPIFGGGYFRLSPAAVTLAAARWLNRAGRPVMFFVHPHDLDPGQPRTLSGPVERFRRYHGVAATEAKLDRVLSAFSFKDLAEFFSG